MASIFTNDSDDGDDDDDNDDDDENDDNDDDYPRSWEPANPDLISVLSA